MVAERRPLTAGLKPDPSVEQQFVRSGKLPSLDPAPPGPDPTPPRKPKPRSATAVSRSPLTTRVRTDFAEALKRASLQRQLDGMEPSTLQDILEEALEPSPESVKSTASVMCKDKIASEGTEATR